MDANLTIKPRNSTVRRVTGRSTAQIWRRRSVSMPHGNRPSRIMPLRIRPRIIPHSTRNASHLLNREREARKQRREGRDEALLRQKAYARVALEPTPALPQSDEGTPRADFAV